MESSLNNALLKQNGGDAVWRDSSIDAACQLFLESIKASGSIKISRPQFPQISLKGVHNPRHQRLNLRHKRRIRQLKHDFNFEVLRTVSTCIRKVDQHIGQINKCRGLGGYLWLLVVVALKEKIGT